MVEKARPAAAVTSAEDAILAAGLKVFYLFREAVGFTPGAGLPPDELELSAQSLSAALLDSFRFCSPPRLSLESAELPDRIPHRSGFRPSLLRTLNCLRNGQRLEVHGGLPPGSERPTLCGCLFSPRSPLCHLLCDGQQKLPVRFLGLAKVFH